MPLSELSYKSADGTQVVAYKWEPEDDRGPLAAVQLTHGMGEHAQRYDHVARALNEDRFVVYAQDHRGHGASADPDAYGDLGEGGWNALVDDIGLLSAKIRADHADLPLILLGHSMGSFAVQQYLLDHSADVDGVVLTGTAVIDLLEPALDLDQPRDVAVVDAYVADPLCGFGIDTSSAKTMFVGARRLADPGQVAVLRNDLPVYIAVGESDPVNGGLTLLHPLADRLRDAGLTDVTVVTYPGARHEILNETNRDDVIDSIKDWTERVAG